MRALLILSIISPALSEFICPQKIIINPFFADSLNSYVLKYQDVFLEKDFLFSISQKGFHLLSYNSDTFVICKATVNFEGQTYNLFARDTNGILNSCSSEDDLSQKLKISGDSLADLEPFRELSANSFLDRFSYCVEISSKVEFGLAQKADVYLKKSSGLVENFDFENRSEKQLDLALKIFIDAFRQLEKLSLSNFAFSCKENSCLIETEDQKIYPTKLLRIGGREMPQVGIFKFLLFIFSSLRDSETLTRLEESFEKVLLEILRKEVSLPLGKSLQSSRIYGYFSLLINHIASKSIESPEKSLAMLQSIAQTINKNHFSQNSEEALKNLCMGLHFDYSEMLKSVEAARLEKKKQNSSVIQPDRLILLEVEPEKEFGTLLKMILITVLVVVAGVFINFVVFKN